ncbi:MAG TPA: adenosine deaminase [Rhodospirillaceae bacterium]|nr:adenosine deaminase [Rhodospirillaceae bacterium]
MEISMQSIRSLLAGTALAILAASGVQADQAPAPTIEKHFAEIAQRTPELTAFLRAMPKGGDLHSHLVGSAYAEEYIAWGIRENMCADTKRLRIVDPPCDKAAGKPPLGEATRNLWFYGELVDSLSTRNYRLGHETGRKKFFTSFDGFDAVTEIDAGPAYNLASAVRRAADQNILYLELMFSEGMRAARKIGKATPWNDDPAKLRQTLLKAGVAELAKKTRKVYDKMEADAEKHLGCPAAQKPSAAPLCGVTVRYIASLKRIVPKKPLFAELVHAFELVKTDPRIVGINLVGPEDAPITLATYKTQMELIGALKKLMPEVPVSLHAGELTIGMVPPRHLRSHIRDAVEIAKASRIGHGIDIMHEDRPYQLLKTMAKRKVLVEINLTSNDIILGIKGSDHPFPTYLKHGVPLAISTDDEGVARINLTYEYRRAVQSYDLTYAHGKTLSRNSLTYAFLKGESLWRDAAKGKIRTECESDPASRACRAFLDKNAKAKLQWRLEEAYRDFEKAVQARLR